MKAVVWGGGDALAVGIQNSKPIDCKVEFSGWYCRVPVTQDLKRNSLINYKRESLRTSGIFYSKQHYFSEISQSHLSYF